MNHYKIALIGNPNVGKTSLFNKLTNLRQKVGNYPGVTVEKREGKIERNGNKFQITDFPGTYTIYPSSLDEEIVFKTLGDKTNNHYPNLAIVVGEPSNLKRSILLYQQVRDLDVPAIFVINMKDEIKSKGLNIDLKKLEDFLQTKIYLTNARTSEGIDELVEAFTKEATPYNCHYEIPKEHLSIVEKIKNEFNLKSDYLAWQYLSQKEVPFESKENLSKLDTIKKENSIVSKRLQVKEALDRNKILEDKLNDIISYNFEGNETLTDKIDKTLIHPVFGYIIFLGILLLIFQAVYAWSAPLMTMVEDLFGWIDEKAISLIPEGPINEIIGGAIIPGIEGIAVFVPQIAILFLFISIMEETGYMSRVVYLMDRWLKPFGLSGKSVVPLISGVACAVPAIMSVRNIENDKERLLTILVTPFMTCSARLPIYIVLIALVIPDEHIFGLSYQALALFVMYILGVLGALGSAILLNLIIKAKHKSYLILEMPTYKLPDWKNVGINVWEKTLGFLVDAGKIIFAISIILWVLGTFGPGEQFKNAGLSITAKATLIEENPLLTAKATSKFIDKKTVKGYQIIKQ